MTEKFLFIKRVEEEQAAMATCQKKDETRLTFDLKKVWQIFWRRIYQNEAEIRLFLPVNFL